MWRCLDCRRMGYREVCSLSLWYPRPRKTWQSVIAFISLCITLNSIQYFPPFLHFQKPPNRWPKTHVFGGNYNSHFRTLFFPKEICYKKIIHCSLSAWICFASTNIFSQIQNFLQLLIIIDAPIDTVKSHGLEGCCSILGRIKYFTSLQRPDRLCEARSMQQSGHLELILRG
jgi:hypothetical protein